MLVLNRRIGQEIVVPINGQLVTFCIIDVRGDKVSVGIEAPKEIQVHRREVWDRIQEKGAAS